MFAVSIRRIDRLERFNNYSAGEFIALQVVEITVVLNTFAYVAPLAVFIGFEECRAVLPGVKIAGYKIIAIQVHPGIDKFVRKVKLNFAEIRAFDDFGIDGIRYGIIRIDRRTLCAGVDYSDCNIFQALIADVALKGDGMKRENSAQSQRQKHYDYFSEKSEIQQSAQQKYRNCRSGKFSGHIQKPDRGTNYAGNV